jgi:hypothetical protein
MEGRYLSCLHFLQLPSSRPGVILPCEVAAENWRVVSKHEQRLNDVHSVSMHELSHIKLTIQSHNSAYDTEPGTDLISESVSLILGTKFSSDLGRAGIPTPKKGLSLTRITTALLPSQSRRNGETTSHAGMLPLAMHETPLVHDRGQVE